MNSAIGSGDFGYSERGGRMESPQMEAKQGYVNQAFANQANKAVCFADERLDAINGKLEKMGALRGALVEKLKPILDMRERPPMPPSDVGVASRGPVSALDRALQEIEYTVDMRLAQFTQLLDDIQL